MSPDQLAKFTEIRSMLGKGYALYDDCHKSADGLCEVSYPTAYGDEGDGCGGIEAYGLMIYSYALGPYRTHTFTRGPNMQRDNHWVSPDPFETARRVVAIWLAQQERMAADPDCAWPDCDGLEFQPAIFAETGSEAPQGNERAAAHLSEARTQNSKAPNPLSGKDVAR